MKNKKVYEMLTLIIKSLYKIDQSFTHESCN